MTWVTVAWWDAQDASTPADMQVDGTPTAETFIYTTDPLCYDTPPGGGPPDPPPGTNYYDDSAVPDPGAYPVNDAGLLTTFLAYLAGHGNMIGGHLIDVDHPVLYPIPQGEAFGPREVSRGFVPGTDTLRVCVVYDIHENVLHYQRFRAYDIVGRRRQVRKIYAA